MSSECSKTLSAEDLQGTFEGKQAIAEAFCNVWETMPDAHWEQHCHFVHNDRGVSEWTFSGTGMDGRRVEAQGADIFTLRDGEIIVKQAFRKNRPPIEI